jgi:hypothetical protein
MIDVLVIASGDFWLLDSSDPVVLIVLKIPFTSYFKKNLNVANDLCHKCVKYQF